MNEIELKKSDKGWIIELPDDVSQEIGVEKGSIAVLYGKNGKVETEIIHIGFNTPSACCGVVRK